MHTAHRKRKALITRIAKTLFGTMRPPNARYGVDEGSRPRVDSGFTGGTVQVVFPESACGPFAWATM